jgi:hypothetical protein
MDAEMLHQDLDVAIVKPTSHSHLAHSHDQSLIRGLLPGAHPSEGIHWLKKSSALIDLRAFTPELEHFPPKQCCQCAVSLRRHSIHQIHPDRPFHCNLFISPFEVDEKEDMEERLKVSLLEPWLELEREKERRFDELKDRLHKILPVSVSLSMCLFH